MAKGDGAAGHNIDRALHQPEKQKPVIDKLGTMVGRAIAWDGCVPDTTPCGCCAACQRRASVRVVAEALEPATGALQPAAICDGKTAIPAQRQR